MSYSTTFRLKEDLDAKFKGFYSKPVTQQEKAAYKNALIALCMRKVTPENYWDYIKIYKELNTAITTYIQLLEEDWKYCITNHFKDTKEIDFYGWQYADDGDISVYETKDDLIEGYASRLYHFSIVSPDEDLEQKLEDITNTVDFIEEAVNDFWYKEFVDFYRNTDRADESDGYNHHFPEEKEEESGRGENNSSKTE